jgi:hypothetical protein
LNPLSGPKSRTKNQQLTPKVFAILKCSGWNIQHNVPTGTFSDFQGLALLKPSPSQTIDEMAQGSATDN